jgi:hypothetical protein
MKSEPVISRKITDGICCQWYDLSFQAKIRILKNFYQSCKLDNFLYLHFSDDINVDTITDLFFDIIWPCKSNHLEELPNSVTHNSFLGKYTYLFLWLFLNEWIMDWSLNW